MKRAVVTGATGAVGRALVDALTASGVETLVLCRDGSARAGQIAESGLLRKRVCSLDGLSGLEGDGRSYDVFYHLAWQGTTGAARDDLPLQTENVRCSLDAVRAAKRLGCRRFVGVGSQAEYGRVEGLLTPDTPVRPETGYGMAKLCAGQMTRLLARQLGMEHRWVRILSVYGPHDGEGSMIMSALLALRRGETPRFTAGEQQWDYLYSGDAAQALLLLGDRGKEDRAYVLGSGQARPLREYILALRDAAAPGAELALGAIPYSAGQVMHLQADVTELARDTGFMPRVDFAEGIRMTAASLDEQ